MTEPRIAPLDPPYSAPVAAALERIMPAGVPPLALFRTLAVNDRVFLRVMAGGLLDRGSITLREREIVIDRTCARCGSEYEWGVHVAFFAERARLSLEEVASTCTEPETGAFSPRERLLLHLVDELHDTTQVSDALWQALAAEWTAEQLIELIALAGFYHLISFMTNALRIPRESYGARFPPAWRRFAKAHEVTGRGTRRGPGGWVPRALPAPRDDDTAAKEWERLQG